jgi:hypothetical protein
VEKQFALIGKCFSSHKLDVKNKEFFLGGGGYLYKRVRPADTPACWLADWLAGWLTGWPPVNMGFVNYLKGGWTQKL